MFFKKIRKTHAQSILEYALLVGMIAAAFASMQIYMRRAVDSNIAKLDKEMQTKNIISPCSHNPCDANACKPGNCCSPDPCANNPCANAGFCCTFGDPKCDIANCAPGACVPVDNTCSSDPCANNPCANAGFCCTFGNAKCDRANCAPGSCCSTRPCAQSACDASKCDDCTNGCKQDCINGATSVCDQNAASYSVSYAGIICSAQAQAHSGCVNTASSCSQRCSDCLPPPQRFSHNKPAFRLASFELAAIPGDGTCCDQCIRDANNAYNQCFYGWAAQNCQDLGVTGQDNVRKAWYDLYLSGCGPEAPGYPINPPWRFCRSTCIDAYSSSCRDGTEPYLYNSVSFPTCCAGNCGGSCVWPTGPGPGPGPGPGCNPKDPACQAQQSPLN